MSDNLGKRSNNLLPICLIAIAVFILICFSAIHSGLKDNPETLSQEVQTEEVPEASIADNVQTQPAADLSNFKSLRELVINPPQEYNYLSKKAIYKIRKGYVESSVFARSDYQPHEAVFGQIESNKPWWGLPNFACHDGDPSYGVSAVSRYLNNPNLLLAPMMIYGYRGEQGREHFCNADYTKYLPTGSYYDPQNRMIFTTYNLHREVIDNPQLFSGMNKDAYFLSLIGMNARDAGYEYVNISKLKNIDMVESYNATQHIYMLQDFIHVGGSCGLEGGCNNISPHQPELDFYVKDLPAAIEVKLWKSEPQKTSSPVDFTYVLVFEETFE